MAVTAVVLASIQTKFSGDGCVSWDCGGSTFDGGDALHTSGILWAAYQSGVRIAEQVGCKRFSVEAEGGNVSVVCSILPASETISGTWTTAYDTVDLGSLAASAECWVDLDAGADGVGTLLDPFNTMVSAVAYLAANHVNGATNRSVCYVKAGTTASYASQLYAGTGKTGDWLFKRYSTGANPQINSTYTGTLLVADGNLSMGFRGIDSDGGWAYASAAANAAFFAKTTDHSTHTNGANIFIADCVWGNYSGFTVNRIDSNQVDSYHNDGSADWCVISNTTFGDTGNGCLLSCRMMQALDVTFGRVKQNNTFRLNHTYRANLRNLTMTATDAANTRLRIHGQYTASSDISICNVNVAGGVNDGAANIQIKPDASDAGTDYAISDLWIDGLLSHRGTSTTGGGIAIIASNLVMRNVESVALGGLINQAAGAEPFDGTGYVVIENCSVYDGRTGGIFTGAIALDVAQAGNVYLRNVAIHTLANTTSSGKGYIVSRATGTARSAANVFADFRNCHLYDPNMGADYGVKGFSDCNAGGDGTVAQLNTALGYTSGCVSSRTADLLFTAPTASPCDLSFNATSPLEDAGSELVGTIVDAGRNKRVTSWDVGSRQRGASAFGDWPEEAVAAVEPIGAVTFLAPRLRTVNG